MQAADRRRSLLDVLGSVPGPSGRQGRRYPVGSLLAVPILPAMNGQSPLRGMWLWTGAHLVFLLRCARDVSFCEDRLPGREVAPGLSAMRNLVLNARADRGLSLLTG